MEKKRKAKKEQIAKTVGLEKRGAVKPGSGWPDLDRRLPGWYAFVLLALAFIIRIIYLLENRSNPFFFEPVLDAANYDQWAQALAEGKGTLQGVFTANPFYPYLLSIIYRLFSHDLVLVRMIQMLAGVATCTFVYFTSVRLFGRTVALFSLLFCCLYGPFIFYEGELLGETWTVLLISAAFYLFSRAGPEQRYTMRFLCISGLVLGLAVLSRPNLILFVPLILLWVAWSFRETGRRISLKGVFILGFGVFIAIAPVTIRNYMKGGEFILLGAHGGVNFFVGNNEDADGWFKVPPGSRLEAGHQTIVESATRIAEDDLGKKLTPSEVSDYWYVRSFNFIRTHPARYLALLGKKLFFSWNAFERPQESNYYLGRQHSRVLRWCAVGFWLVGPLSLLGLVLAFSRRREIGWLYLFIASGLFSIVLFFVSPRYRLPLIPALLPFAAFGCVTLFHELWVKHWKKSVRIIVFLLLFAVFVNWPVSGKEEAMSHFSYVLGNNAFERKDYGQAIYYYEQSVRKAENAIYLNNLGIAYKEAEQYEKAAEAYERAIAINPGLWRPYYNLGVVSSLMGKYEDSEGSYLKAIEVNPLCELAYHNLGNLYSSLGRNDDAIAAYEKAIEANPSFLDSYYNLSLEYGKGGRLEDEARILEKLISRAAGKVDPAIFRWLQDYYERVSPDPERADFYKRYHLNERIDKHE